LRAKDFKNGFDELHKQLERLKDERNNQLERNKLDWIIKNILYDVADRVWQVRYLEPCWSDSDRYQTLPPAQKKWLDQQYKEIRQQQTDWQGAIKAGLDRWLVTGYKKTLGDDAFPIEDPKYSPHFGRLIDECEAALL
jgi:hypothetical protein